MGLANNKFNGTYAIVIADGSIRVKANEGDKDAVLREFKLSDGTEDSKWEKVYSELSGIITAINFRDTDFGKVIQLTFSDNDEEIILSLSTASNFGEDLMKKLPALDFSKPVKVIPYSFEDKKTKKLKKGVTVYQGDAKIPSFFSDENNKPINGFPVVEDGKQMDKDDWKVYFISARKFLVEYIINNVLDKLSNKDSVDKIIDHFGGEEVSEEISVNSVPFN